MKVRAGQGTACKVISGCTGIMNVTKFFMFVNDLCVILFHSEPGSSVSTVSGYGLDDRAIEVPSPTEAKGFFL
jgi:hypothetical protein